MPDTVIYGLIRRTTKLNHLSNFTYLNILSAMKNTLNQLIYPSKNQSTNRFDDRKHIPHNTTALGLIRHAVAQASIVLQSEQTKPGMNTLHHVGHVTAALFGKTIYDTRHVLNFPLLNANIYINLTHFLSL